MLQFTETGPRDAPAVVFLHGGGLSRRMWQPQLERLPGLHCLAPDLPEHGESRTIQPFLLDDAALRVADLIHERVPGGKASLVGLSLGGAVTLTLLQRTPQAVERAMVTGTAAGLSRTLAWIAEASLWMVRLFPPQKLVEATARQMGIPTEFRPLFDEDLLHTSSPDFTRRLYRELASMPLPAAVNVPLLVMVGEGETPAARAAARKLLRLYPGAQGRLVPRLGHVWSLQDPDLFARTVQAWVCGDPLPEGLRGL
jgi:pimeloyl-ACP methyl ester carboxylesterase